MRRISGDVALYSPIHAQNETVERSFVNRSRLGFNKVTKAEALISDIGLQ
jgi:hypothetical protein